MSSANFRESNPHPGTLDEGDLATTGSIQVDVDDAPVQSLKKRKLAEMSLEKKNAPTEKTDNITSTIPITTTKWITVTVHEDFVRPILQFQGINGQLLSIEVRHYQALKKMSETITNDLKKQDVLQWKQTRIGEHLYVTIKNYKGGPTMDLRVWHHEAPRNILSDITKQVVEPKLKPTKLGVSLRLSSWVKINFNEVDEALQKVCNKLDDINTMIWYLGGEVARNVGTFCEACCNNKPFTVDHDCFGLIGGDYFRLQKCKEMTRVALQSLDEVPMYYLPNVENAKETFEFCKKNCLGAITYLADRVINCNVA